jgi:hypothetical protein
MRKQGCSEQLDPIVVFGVPAACKLERALPITFRDLALNQGMETVVEQTWMETLGMCSERTLSNPRSPSA